MRSHQFTSSIFVILALKFLYISIVAVIVCIHSHTDKFIANLCKWKVRYFLPFSSCFSHWLKTYLRVLLLDRADHKVKGLLNMCLFGYVYDHTNDRMFTHCHKHKKRDQFIDFINGVDFFLLILKDSHQQ